jgi:hypothetical protein
MGDGPQKKKILRPHIFVWCRLKLATTRAIYAFYGDSKRKLVG